MAFLRARNFASAGIAKRSGKTNELGFGEFSELLRAARKLLTGVRGIDGNDLNLPERNVGSQR